MLTVRDVGSWWLAIPNAGIFIKNFVRGRKATLMMIKKSKYREVLQRVCIMCIKCLLILMTATITDDKNMLSTSLN